MDVYGIKSSGTQKPLCVGAKPWLVLLPLSLLFIYSSIIVGKTCYFWCRHLFANSRFQQLRTQISIQKTTSLPHFFRHLRYSDSSKSSSPPTKWSLVEFLFPTCQQALQSLKQTARPNYDPFVLSFGLIQGRLVFSFRTFQGGGSKIWLNILLSNIGLKITKKSLKPSAITTIVSTTRQSFL